MEIKSFSHFDAKVFQSICDLHNELCCEHPLHQVWKIDTNLKDFLENSAFTIFNHWKIFLLQDDEYILACAIVTMRKNSDKDFASLGYFEARAGIDLELLFNSCEQYARYLGASDLRGPIQGSIFNSYKFKLDSEVFMGGDPVHPAYYPKLWEQYGFKLDGRWSNIEPSRLSYYLQLVLPFLRLSYFSPISVRKYEPSNSKQELANVYRIVMDSYSKMHSFEQVSFEEFESWNSGLLDILNDWNCLFVMIDGLEIGFNINIPLPFCTHNSSKKRLMLAYIGKIKNLGKRGRGVGDSVTRFQVWNGLLPILSPVPIVTGVYESSPIRKWLVRLGMKELSCYGLYIKKL